LTNVQQMHCAQIQLEVVLVHVKMVLMEMV